MIRKNKHDDNDTNNGKQRIVMGDERALTLILKYFKSEVLELHTLSVKNIVHSQYVYVYLKTTHVFYSTDTLCTL